MRYCIAFLIVLIISSCRKSDMVDRSKPEYILKSGKWYLSKEQWLKYDITQNLLLEDTTYYSDSCQLASYFTFLDDSICYKKEVCFLGGAPELPGKWFVQGDTLISASIESRLSYGTGYLPLNIGILPGKLIEISNDHFVVKRMYWFPYYGPNTTVRDTVIATYRKL